MWIWNAGAAFVLIHGEEESNHESVHLQPTTGGEHFNNYDFHFLFNQSETNPFHYLFFGIINEKDIWVRSDMWKALVSNLSRNTFAQN